MIAAINLAGGTRRERHSDPHERNPALPPGASLRSSPRSIVWSGWQPYDRFTWWLEVSPAFAGLAILLATYRRFRFTTLCYTLIALHMCVLCVGGHYTYARVPVFDWLRPIFGWERNHYDRLGHLHAGIRAGDHRARAAHSPRGRRSGRDGSRFWSSRFAWPSARSTNCWNGGRP